MPETELSLASGPDCACRGELCARAGTLGAGRNTAARVSSVLILFSLLGAAAFAQQLPQASQNLQSVSQNAEPSSSADSQDQAHQRSNHIFSVVPNYLTVNKEQNQEIAPLSAGEKFKLNALNAFDPGSFLVAGITAGVQQAEGTYPEWGQGAAGYGRRFAGAFADQTIESFATSAVFPSLFRQDPRYFRLGQGSFLHRAGYAFSRIVVTRTDAGGSAFNISEVLGASSAAAIGVAYHPAADRTAGGAAQILGTDIAIDSMFNVFREFWPDIQHKLHWKRLPL
jgi:hypothetical protein